MTSRSEPGRAAVIGTGLIGGSLGLALRARGWKVTGEDSDPEVARNVLWNSGCSTRSARTRTR